MCLKQNTKGSGSREGTRSSSSFVVPSGEHLPEPIGGGVQKRWEQSLFPPPCGLQDASGCFIAFFLGWGRGWLPLNRFSCERGLGAWRRQDVNRAQLSEASKIVCGWSAASIHHGWEESWWGGPAMLSRYLICSLFGHAALRICLQLQPVLIIRSEYSSPWAYDRKPEQNSIPHFKLGLPFFVCVCSFCLFLV